MLKKIFPVLLIILLIILGLSGTSGCWRRYGKTPVVKPTTPVPPPANTPIPPEEPKPLTTPPACSSCSEQSCLLPEQEVLPLNQSPAPVLTIPSSGPDNCLQPDLTQNESKPKQSRKPPARNLRKLAPSRAVKYEKPPKEEGIYPDAINAPIAAKSAPVQTVEAPAPTETSDESQNEVLLWMVRSGHTDGVQSLLKAGVSDQDRAEAFIAAAEYGREKILTSLSEQGELGAAVYLQALETAAEHGRLKAVRTLLANTNVLYSSSARGQAIVKAVQHGHRRHLETTRNAIVSELLKYDEKISEEDRGQAVIFAAQNDYPNIVHRLLNDGPLAQQDYIEALSIASKKGHGKVVEELLNFTPN